MSSSELQDLILIIDYSSLTSDTANDRSKVVHDIGKACEDWGCFMLVNHGIPETLIKEMMDMSNEFFNMTNEEKLEFEAHGVLDPIRCSTGFNKVNHNKDSLWREYLRLIVHPVFNCPHKPTGFSELASDYVRRTRAVAAELLKGVSESLGFEASYMNKELNLDSGFQLLAINYYTSLSESDLSRGYASHGSWPCSMKMVFRVLRLFITGNGLAWVIFQTRSRYSILIISRFLAMENTRVSYIEQL